MIVTRAEIIKSREQLLRQMHQYIIDIGDEMIYDWWITDGVPDCPSDEDFEYIAQNDDEWSEICSLFGTIVMEKAED